MDNFKITCEKGITYTDIENFVENFLENQDELSQENVEYLEALIWEYIETSNEEVPEYIIYIITDLIEFIYDFTIDKQLIECDLYKGWEFDLIILQNPKTGNYFSIEYSENRWGDHDYPNGYTFNRVRKIDKVIQVWEQY